MTTTPTRPSPSTQPHPQPQPQPQPRTDAQPGAQPEIQATEHRYETAKGCLLLSAAVLACMLIGAAAIVLFGDYPA